MDNLTREDQFSKAFSPYGNRLDTTNDPNIMDLRIKCQQTISQYSSLDIYFDFIDNEAVNAIATKFEGSYFIGIYVGTIKVFGYLARKIASHPKTLFDFGNPSMETNFSKVYNAIIKNANHIIEDDPPAWPATDERQKLCILIYQQSILNILFHEIAHIVNGHIDYVQLLNIGYLEEVQNGKSNLSQMRSLDIQTLEIDADGSSALRTLQELWAIFDSDEDNFKCILHDYRSLFKLWSFVRFMCWRVMENSYVGQDLLGITHPPTAIRHDFTRIACIDLVKGRNAMLIEEYEISMALGVSATDEAFKFLSEIDPITPPLSKQLSILQKTHGAMIFAHWDFLRNQLLEFATDYLKEPNIYNDDNESFELQNAYKQLISHLKAQ